MILNVFAEGSAGSIFVKHLQWYMHVLFLSLVMWDDVMWWGCAMWFVDVIIPTILFHMQGIGACEWAFTCFFSGIGNKVRETLSVRTSFGPRSHLVPNLVRASFQERFLKELGHLNAWCCYWSGAWCCCWCCWVLLLLVLPLVLYWGLSRARRFVASVPLDMTIWKEAQVLRSFFPCCKCSVPCCSMMQSHLNYDEICTSFEVGVTCVPLCLYFPIFL